MEKLQNWLKQNGYDEIKVHLDENGFFFDIIAKDIGLGIYAEEDTDAYFAEFLRNNGCEYVDYVPAPVLAFLHELGHYHTIYDFEEAELIFYAFIKEAIDADNHMTEKEKAFAYWESPDELDANIWEIKYIMNDDNADAIGDLIDCFKEIYK